MPLPTTTVMRMALCLWLCDDASGLTQAQAAWLRARLDRPDWVPSSGERAALRTPLLQWCAARQSQSLPLIDQQFAEGVPNARS